MTRLEDILTPEQVSLCVKLTPTTEKVAKVSVIEFKKVQLFAKRVEMMTRLPVEIIGFEVSGK